MSESACHTSVTAMLLSLVDEHKLGVRFVGSAGEETFFPYSQIVNRAKTAAAVLRARGVRPGDRVAVILPTDVTFLDAFLGAQLARAIPAALYPPFRLGRLEEYSARIEEMLERMGAKLLITDARTKLLLGGAAAVKTLEGVLVAQKLAVESAVTDWSDRMPRAEDTAFLQFSSGTTLYPKAVRVTHANLMANLRMSSRTFDHSFQDPTAAERGALAWLPLYHDMGLVGFLYQGLSYPATVTFLRPECFVGRPARWLQAMSKYRAAISAAPSFAYGICTLRISDAEMGGVDLSDWLVAFNGAEPIDVDVMQRFCDRFEKWGFRRTAMTPVYGLAEAVLGVSFPKLGSGPLVTEFDAQVLRTEGRAMRGVGRSLPSVGQPLEGLSLEIRDGEGQVLPETWAGRIHVSGATVTPGYLNDAGLTENVLAEGWLDTGDVGFLFEGNLYIAGRAKDVIILRGANHAPQEFEEPVNRVDGVRRGCVAAVSAEVESEGEQLIILAEQDLRSPRAEEELVSDIRGHLLKTVHIAPWHIEILAPGTLPRTSSGKLRRAEARRLFLAGELAPGKATALRVLKELAKSQISWMRFGRGKPRQQTSSGGAG